MSSFSSASSGKEDKMKPATCTIVIDDFANFTSHKYSAKLALPPDNIVVQVLVDSNTTLTCPAGWGAGKYSTILLFNWANSGSFVVHYRLSLVNSNNHKLFTVDGKINFENIGQFKLIHAFFQDDLVNPTNQFLDKGRLHIYCELYKVDSILDEDVAIIKPLCSQLLQDYAKLLKNGKQSDVTLIASGSELKAHKSILPARSSVFSAMFEHDTKEKQQNRVTIEEISTEVCKQMLNYIYTDKVDKLEVHAADLMAAADRYQLDHLKRLCEQYLCSNLTIETVAQILVLADLHQADALKLKCMEFIFENCREVKATDGWKLLLAKVELFAEVLLHSSDKNRMK